MILTRQQLNQKIWQAADILRGSLDSSDFKNHILSLLFLKRLSDVFDERHAQIVEQWTAAGKSEAEALEIADDPDEYGDGAYYLPEESRWSHLMKVSENRAEKIDIALVKAEEENAHYLEGVLGGVRFNDERRFGDPSAMDALMGKLLYHFSEIPLGNKNLLEPDVLGNAYEYLIEQFAETAGKKGGEFYTPRSVVRLLVEVLDPQEGMRIHDPTCGSGGMLIECGHHVEERGGDPRNLTLTGQEKNYGTWAICRLNMLLHGFPDADIRAGDTIRSPQFTTGGALDAFHRVIANPPFSLKQWGHESAEADTYARFSLGVPPKTKGDMAFLLHMLKVVQPEQGMAGVVLPHGVLFRGAAEGKIRQQILENDLVEAVIGLPAQLFFGTGIPAALLICNWNKPPERRGKVLFVDASTEGLFRSGKSRNFLDPRDILRVAAIYHGYAEPEAVMASSDEIADRWTGALLDHQQTQLEKIGENDVALREYILDDFGGRLTEISDAKAALAEWYPASHAKLGGGTRTSLEKHAAVVPLEEIEQEHRWNLNITRYVDASEPPEQLDVATELKKLRKLEKERDEAEKEMDRLLEEFGYGG